MAKECKFLALDFEKWYQYEAELNKWINQGYEVKHIIPQNSLSSKMHYFQGTIDYQLLYDIQDDGYLFYLERTVPGNQAPTQKPEPKKAPDEESWFF